jgi:hypothetical protein
MFNTRSLAVLFFIAILGFGCETVVLRQEIPVTTNPMGAKIYVNGQPRGQTPGAVSLERNRNHVITLLKEGYRQEDVMVQKQYQSNRVLMKAIHSGISAGTFFKDAGMGINSGFSSVSRQEETGEAYLLVPPVVKVNLYPLSGPGTGWGPAGGQSPDTSPPPEADLTPKDLLRAGVVAGSVAAAQGKPIEKKWETSSSSRTYTKSDGTMVSEKSSTSVGVGVNPAGLFDLIDQMMK